MTATPADLLPRDAAFDERGRLSIGGCDIVALAERAGTPAYVYAEADLRARARAFRDAARVAAPGASVHLAVKALPCRAAVRLAAEEGLGWEASSAGELRLALEVGADPARGVLTGADKADATLRHAIEAGVGLLVADSEDEILRADALALRAGRCQAVLLSVVPRAPVAGIRHDPVSGQLDWKAGFGLTGGQAVAAAELLQAAAGLRLAGIHVHLGARLRDQMPAAIAQAADFVAEQRLPCDVFDVGGGPNAPVARGAAPPPVSEHVTQRAACVRRELRRVGRAMPRLVFEPGQAIVGPAGVTVYRVRGVKRGVRTYVTVDGGLHENPRPLIYGMAQEALLARRSDAPPERVSVAGLTPEAGDVLAWDVELPVPRIGDVLVIPATGAYVHAMSSNWNLQPRPPVLFCAGGRARTVVRRETHDDVVRRDLG